MCVGGGLLVRKGDETVRLSGLAQEETRMVTVQGLAVQGVRFRVRVCLVVVKV